MDRQLAERMVGAACLLAVLVLVVPAILDGNPDSGATITHPAVEEELDLRTHTIRLDGAEREPPVPTPRQAQGAPERPVETAPETAPPESPPVTDLEPTCSRPAMAPPAAGPRPPSRDHWPRRRRSPLPRPRRRPRSTEPATGSSSWAASRSRTNADRLAADLKSKGFSVSVQGGGGSSGTLFRVRAGPEPDKAACGGPRGPAGGRGLQGRPGWPQIGRAMAAPSGAGCSPVAALK